MLKSLLAGSALMFAMSAAPALAAPQCDPGNGGINLPKGFCALVVANNMGEARHAVAAPNGDLYVASCERSGGVVALHDSKGDGHFDVVQKFASGSSTGIGFYNGYLYVAQPTQVIRFKMTPGQMVPTGQPETVVSGFDPAREHNDKGLAFDGKGFLYLNIGSPSNACQSRDRMKGSPGQDPCPVLQRHSGIWKFDANKLNQTQDDGTKLVTGLRQEPDVAWAYNGVYTVMNNRDQIDELYPEHFTAEDNNEGPAEVMYRADQGLNFGWPYCYFDYRLSKSFARTPNMAGTARRIGRCTQFSPPIAAYPAHWAPVDLTFYEGKQFPAKYRGGALIAFHGSWNRRPDERPGAVVFQPFGDGKPSGKFEVFADGFTVTPVTDQSKYTGRPDGVAVAPDGSLYITDSEKGKIWRVFLQGLSLSGPIGGLTQRNDLSCDCRSRADATIVRARTRRKTVTDSH